MYNGCLHFPSFRTVVISSVVLRIALILYSEWHDAHSVLKYTDIDYHVFTDSAHFVRHPGAENVGRGPFGQWLNVGDPYTRETYRYTPLLAVLLTPNEWLHASFGKYVFAGCDILSGLLMHRILRFIILPAQHKRINSSDRKSVRTASEVMEKQATFLTAIHLLNPLVFTISTRGSSESILSLLVLSTLSHALQGRWDTTAVMLGLSTHWKIYPFIYGVSCVAVIAHEHGGDVGWIRSLISKPTIRFSALSAGTFFALNAAMYIIWGFPFLNEAFLYHIHRLDHRHNFSPYFYLTYLTYPGISPSSPSAQAEPPPAFVPLLSAFLRSPLASFVPQMGLALGTGVLFGSRGRAHLPFTWFVQTVVFVLFNKVCTSQYFLWYLLFFPLLIPRLALTPLRSILLVLVWAGAQALWLAEAYKLEFLGENVFFSLWVRSLAYVAGHAWVLGVIIEAYAR